MIGEHVELLSSSSAYSLYSDATEHLKYNIYCLNDFSSSPFDRTQHY